MTTQEFDKVVKDELYKRSDLATAKMEKCETLKSIFEDMARNGFAEQAKAFRDMIRLYFMMKPDATEAEVAEDIFKRMMAKAQ